MKRWTDLLFVLLPLLAMYLVVRNKMDNLYILETKEQHTVLMYLDLMMYVMIALVVATAIRNILEFRETKKRHVFGPTIFITVCTTIVTVFNVFIYETEMEKHNKALLTAELEQLHHLSSDVRQKQEALVGYWLARADDGSASTIYYYNEQGEETIYIRNTNYKKADPVRPYEIVEKDDALVLTTERFGENTEEHIRFQDENTLVGVHDQRVGVFKRAFRNTEIETFTFTLERITEEEFVQYQQQNN